MRREAEILRSYFNLGTVDFCSSPKPVPATWVCEKLDARRDLMHVDLKRCRKSILYQGVARGWPLICAQDQYVPVTAANASQMDYIGIEKPTPKDREQTALVSPLPGESFHAC